MHELSKFSEFEEEKESGGGDDIGRSFSVYIGPRGVRKAGPGLSLRIPREMAGRAARLTPPQLSLSLVSPWQIFNSTATWKNRILPMLAATRPAIPHRGGGMCVWALEAASIHTLLGNLISTKKLI